MEVAMKKTMSILLFLLALVPSAFAVEEDLRMAVQNTCQYSTRHVQETRWCMTWTKELEGWKEIRPSSEQDDVYIRVVAIIQFDEESDMLAVNTSVMFISQFFGGAVPLVMTNLKLIPVTSWRKEAHELRMELKNVLPVWLDEILGCIERVKCQNPILQHVRGMNEEDTVTAVTAVTDDGWNSTGEGCTAVQ
jgi:hypothetical protein